jgi:hypothetical protein
MKEIMHSIPYNPYTNFAVIKPIGGKNMEVNPSIQCKVTECKYNALEDGLCTLNQITVGKKEDYTTKPEETDCESFQVKHSDSFS